VTTGLFGEGIARREDPRLLRGAGRYLDDLGADALQVAFVRSPHAHARVSAIDVSGAPSAGRSSRRPPRPRPTRARRCPRPAPASPRRTCS
jgi:hypothetical protein